MLRSAISKFTAQQHHKMSFTLLGSLAGQTGGVSLRNAFLSRGSDKVGLGVRRGFCTKPQEGKLQPEKPSEAQPMHPKEKSAGFRMSEFKPSEFDIKTLLWSGRYKTREEIPEMVTFGMLDTARHRVRVKVSYIMIILTLIGCVVMVVQGKRAAARNESLTGWNQERKLQWKKEAQSEQQASAVKVE